jgi:hypothetical protein
LATFIHVNEAADKNTSLTHYSITLSKPERVIVHHLFLSQMRLIPTTGIQHNMEEKESSEKNVFMSSPYFNFPQYH